MKTVRLLPTTGKSAIVVVLFLLLSFITSGFSQTGKL